MTNEQADAAMAEVYRRLIVEGSAHYKVVPIHARDWYGAPPAKKVDRGWRARMERFFARWRAAL